MNLLQGKVTLVTGASRGIGAACVRTLAGADARVAINYFRSREKPEEVLRENGTGRIRSKPGPGVSPPRNHGEHRSGGNDPDRCPPGHGTHPGSNGNQPRSGRFSESAWWKTWPALSFTSLRRRPLSSLATSCPLVGEEFSTLS